MLKTREEQEAKLKASIEEARRPHHAAASSSLKKGGGVKDGAREGGGDHGMPSSFHKSIIPVQSLSKYKSPL